MLVIMQRCTQFLFTTQDTLELVTLFKYIQESHQALLLQNKGERNIEKPIRL